VRGLLQWGDYAGLFDKDRPHRFTAAVERARADRGDCGNLLIFDRVEVLPEYRGNDLALRYYNAAILRFGAGCSLAVLKPFPLQCESTCDEPASKAAWRQSLRLSDFSRDRRAATVALKRHYERCGFKPLRGSPLMLLELTDWQAILRPAE
jgi:GNAT superfamily N-acetyltransferase